MNMSPFDGVCKGVGGLLDDAFVPMRRGTCRAPLCDREVPLDRCGDLRRARAPREGARARPAGQANEIKSAVRALPIPLTSAFGPPLRRFSKLTIEMMRVASGDAATALPGEVWTEVFGYLKGEDLVRALCACKTFSGLSSHAWQRACLKRWPRWASVAAEPGAQWRRQFELLSLRELCESMTVDPAKIRATQTTITERHRAILAEWLCELAYDWNLETTLVFKSIYYLDFYLAARPADLSRLQLIGLACLRAAMGHSRAPTALSVSSGDSRKGLEASRFADASADAYSAADVEEWTLAVQGYIPQGIRISPNPKMFLRSFWYRACVQGVLHSDDMHVYTLAGFLSQLALLDLDAAVVPAPRAAAAALAAALAFYGHGIWPQALVRFGSFEEAELAPDAARLWRLQATVEAPQLRRIWVGQYAANGYDEHRREWAAALAVFAAKGAREGGWQSWADAGMGLLDDAPMLE